MRQLLDASPPAGLQPISRFAASKGSDYYLYYFGVGQPAIWTLDLPDDQEYVAEVIDTWEMTVTPLPGTISGKATVELPGRPYLALQVRLAGA